MLFIIDIDVTLSDHSHREHLLNPGPDGVVSQDQWDSFLHPKLLLLDKPLPKAQAVVKGLRKQQMDIHFLTGRNERLREVTESWLKEHFDWDRKREGLIMRGLGHANTSASVYKEHAFKKILAYSGHPGPYVFIDDDPYVLRMFTTYGLCMKAPEIWDYFNPEAIQGEEPRWRK